MMALRVGKDPLDYINEAKSAKRHNMKRRFQECRPDNRFVDRFEHVSERFYLIIFSADWCSDCNVYVPSLAKTLLIAKNNLISAKVVDYDSYKDIAHDLKIKNIPTMIIYDKNWREVGRFVETPKKAGTVEEEICMIMESKKTDPVPPKPPEPDSSMISTGDN